MTAYEGDDPNCTPSVYNVGDGFVDPGGDHVHIIRNEGTVEARTIAVQLVPADATRRIDVAIPATSTSSPCTSSPKTPGTSSPSPTSTDASASCSIPAHPKPGLYGAYREAWHLLDC